jgi:hypothetical protein
MDKPMTPHAFTAMVVALPETEAGTSCAHPSLKNGGTFLTRLRAEDNRAVVYVDSVDQRDMLLEAVDPDWLRSALTARWRKLATRKAVKAFDALAAPSPQA